MAGEPIGEIDVLISGDYCGLTDAINQAVSLATSGASAIEEAFSSANIAQTANQAAGQVQVIGEDDCAEHRYARCWSGAGQVPERIRL